MGEGCHCAHHPVGFSPPATASSPGEAPTSSWAVSWACCFQQTVFFVPGLGLVAMAGPFVLLLVGVLVGTVPVGGVSAIDAALSQLGAPKDQIVK